MSQSSTYKKLIFKHDISVHKILKCLATLPHVVYLQNQQCPIIGLMSTSYVQITNSKIQSFKRVGLSEYVASDEHAILSFEFNKAKNKNTPSFTGGLIGFVSYDYAANQHTKISIKAQPSLFLGEFQSYLKLESTGWYFYSHEDIADDIFNYILNLTELNQSTLVFALNTPCQARWTKSEYDYAFNSVQEYIKAGDCYQINLTQEFTAKAHGSLVDTADDFWSLTQAPYSGYLRVGDFELLSCSPELFIDFQAERKIITKPIKGTMPRYANAQQDEASKQQLKNSEKDMAENVMIVDLLRNDLSVYAETGSVKTPKLFDIESFNQVHHMVSKITAILKPDVNPLSVLMSALPGGSITGAPKIRAMQIIEELEGASRGAYCGSLGYFNHDGTGCWNILIRSIQKYQEDLSLWAGGGITIASDCDAEYQECFDKVEAMLDLLNNWYIPE